MFTVQIRCLSKRADCFDKCDRSTYNPCGVRIKLHGIVQYWDCEKYVLFFLPHSVCVYVMELQLLEPVPNFQSNSWTFSAFQLGGVKPCVTKWCARAMYIVTKKATMWSQRGPLVSVFYSVLFTWLKSVLLNSWRKLQEKRIVTTQSNCAILLNDED